MLSLTSRSLRLFFQYFYHQFAWTYDLVAGVVSIGRWNLWIRSVLPFLRGQNILEIGFGPGHLQEYLLSQGNLRVAGLDESRQMGLLARRRLKASSLGPINLVRGWAQDLPFPSRTFDTVVSTFPSEYIFDARTLAQVHRVLRDDGRLVVVPAAWIVGRRLTDRAAAWLFRITHQAPPSPQQVLASQLESNLREARFEAQFETVEMVSSLVYVIKADKATISS